LKRIRIWLRVIVDILLLVAGLINVATGLMLFFGLAQGPGRSKEAALSILELSSKGLSRLIHNYSGIIIIALVIFHLMLNFNTFLCFFRSIRKNLKLLKNKKIYSDKA